MTGTAKAEVWVAHTAEVWVALAEEGLTSYLFNLPSLYKAALEVSLKASEALI